MRFDGKQRQRIQGVEEIQGVGNEVYCSELKGK